MRRLLALAILLFSCAAWGQYGGDKSYVSGSSGGTSVTVHLGGVNANTTNVTDNGDANAIFFTGFTTPSVMSGPAWGNCYAGFSSPDSATPAWGCALYSSQSISGTLTSVGTTLAWASGGTFPTTAAGGLINIQTANGLQVLQLNTVSSSISAATILAPFPACSTACNFTIYWPYQLLCSTFSSTVAATGYNAGAVSSCGTPATNTVYFAALGLASNSQYVLNAGGFTLPCPSPGAGNEVVQVLGSFTSNASWPATISTSGSSAGDVGDSCIAAYMDLTYTTSAQYTIVTSSINACDSPSTTCKNLIPPISSGQVLHTWAAVTRYAISAPTDSASDTFTLVGAGSAVTGTGVTLYSNLYYTHATAGTNSVTCNIATLNKNVCASIVVQGEASGSNLDQSCYDTAISTWNTTTGATTGACATSTTSQAQEFVLGTAYNQLYGSCCSPYTPTGVYNASGSWGVLGNFANVGSSPQGIGMFYYTSSTTGTPSVSSFTAPTTSNEISTWTATFK